MVRVDEQKNFLIEMLDELEQNNKFKVLPQKLVFLYHPHIDIYNPLIETNFKTITISELKKAIQESFRDIKGLGEDDITDFEFEFSFPTRTIEFVDSHEVETLIEKPKNNDEFLERIKQMLSSNLIYLHYENKVPNLKEIIVAAEKSVQKAESSSFIINLTYSISSGQISLCINAEIKYC